MSQTERQLAHLRRRWIGLVALLVAAAGAAGCSKKKTDTTPPKPEATSKMRCRFPAETLKMLHQQGDDPSLTDKQREAQIRSMLRHCTGWPPAVKAMAIMSYATPEERAAMLRMKNSQQEVDRHLEEVCPGVIQLLKTSGGMSPGERFSSIDRHCRVERFGLMSQREFRIAPFENLLAIVIHQLLRKSGVDPRAARALARQLMGRGHLGIAVKEGEMVLPRSSSRTIAVEATQLQLSASAVLVDNKPVANVKNGRFDANTKRDGPDGYFIDPLFKRLKKVARRARRAASKRLGRGHLVVAVHKGTPWKAFAEVIYTARQAGYERFQLVVASNSIWDRALLFEGVTGGVAPSTEPRLRLSRKTLTLTLGGTSAPKVFPATRDKLAASLKALAAFLHLRAAKLKAAGRWGVIHVEVGDTLKFATVVTVLDALRQKPGTRPGSCRFALDTGSGTWTLPAATRAGCLLPHPRLHVGPPPAKAPPSTR